VARRTHHPAQPAPADYTFFFFCVEQGWMKRRIQPGKSRKLLPEQDETQLFTREQIDALISSNLAL